MPAQTAQPGLLSPEERVEDNLTRLTSGDSALVQQARASGMEAAQSRGLLNSSIAVGAAEDAANRAALPVAQQDAGQAFTRGQQTREFGQQTGLQTQAERARAGLSAQEAGQQLTAQTQAENLAREQQIKDIQAREGLSRQEAEQALRAQTQGETSRAALSAQEATQQSGLLAQDTEFRAEMAAYDRDTQAYLNDIQTQNAILLQNNDAAKDLMLQTGEQISQILQNPDMSQAAKDEAIRRVQANAQNSLDLLSSISTGGEVPPPPPPPPPPPGGPPEGDGAIFGQIRVGSDGERYIWSMSNGGEWVRQGGAVASTGGNNTSIETRTNNAQLN